MNIPTSVEEAIDAAWAGVHAKLPVSPAVEAAANLVWSMLRPALVKALKPEPPVVVKADTIRITDG